MFYKFQAERNKILSDTFKADQKLCETVVDILQAMLHHWLSCLSFVEHHSARGIWWDHEHKDFEQSTGTAHGKCGSPRVV